MEPGSYEIKKVIAEVGTHGNYSKLLTLTSWSGGTPKIDLRAWRILNGAPVMPGKGITLTEAEAQTASEAIFSFLRGN